MKRIVVYCSLLIVLFSFLYAGDKADTQVDILAKTTKSWNGNELPRYPWGKPEVTLLRISIPPHTELAWHEHPVINAGVVISGELTVITDQQDTLLLRKGDPIVEVVNTWHYGKNNGDETVDIIVFYAGVKGKEITKYKK